MKIETEIKLILAYVIVGSIAAFLGYYILIQALFSIDANKIAIDIGKFINTVKEQQKWHARRIHQQARTEVTEEIQQMLFENKHSNVARDMIPYSLDYKTGYSRALINLLTKLN